MEALIKLDNVTVLTTPILGRCYIMWFRVALLSLMDVRLSLDLDASYITEFLEFLCKKAPLGLSARSSNFWIDD